MKKIIFSAGLFYFFIILLIPASVCAGNSVFKLTPLTSTTIRVPRTGNATVQYLVQNMSGKSHTIVMKAIAGITQLTSAGNCPSPFVLAGKQACTLTLQVNGSQISNGIHGGPVICQQGQNGQPNPLMCYQPGTVDILNITVVPYYIFYSGTQNGNVYYSINNGSTWTATTIPGGGSPVNSVFATTSTLYAATANGFIYYSANNGTSWSNTSQPDGSAVNSVFVKANTLYAGTANGNVCYSTNGGNSWNFVSQPDGSSVNSIYVASNGLYAGTANGNVYYSSNNGTSWTVFNSQPDGSAIRSIFVTNSSVYVDTANEYVYSSQSLTGGGWKTVRRQYIVYLSTQLTIPYMLEPKAVTFSLLLMILSWDL